MQCCRSNQRRTKLMIILGLRQIPSQCRILQRYRKRII